MLPLPLGAHHGAENCLCIYTAHLDQFDSEVCVPFLVEANALQDESDNLLLPRQRSPNTKEHENLETTLLTLPPEILHMITKYLPTSDTASLVLCNHTLFGVLGSKHLSALHSGKDKKDRESFLSTLTPDLPGHFSVTTVLISIDVTTWVRRARHYSRTVVCAASKIHPNWASGIASELTH